MIIIALYLILFILPFAIPFFVFLGFLGYKKEKERDKEYVKNSKSNIEYYLKKDLGNSKPFLF